MIKPMLAESSPRPVGDEYPAVFRDGNYIWEYKEDGIRVLSFINRGIDSLQARSGTDKTRTFPELRIETKCPATLDGEVVSATGLSFQDSIQKRMNRIHDIDSMAKLFPAKKVIFDILEVNGENIEHLPLEARKEILADIFIPTNNSELGIYSEDGAGMWRGVLAKGLEGLVGKRKDGLYLRNKRHWLKVKAWKRNYGKDSTGETFLVVGYTKGTGWRESTFGALVLGRLEKDGSTTYVGGVGTGMKSRMVSVASENVTIAGLMSMFSIVPACPWAKEPERATWVKPFPIRIQYLEYSNDGMVRFPSFKGVV